LRDEIARLTKELAAEREESKRLKGEIAFLKAQPVGIPS
jgi:hypothetical protein